MRRFSTIIVLVVLFAFAVPAATQDNVLAEGCDTEAVITNIASLLLDVTDPIAVLRAIQEATSLALLICSDLTFTSSDYPSNQVSAPIEFPAGIFVAHLSTGTPETDVLFQFEELDGDCGVSAGYVFTTGKDGDEEVVRSEGCRALIVVRAEDWDYDEATDPEWTVTFEKVQ